MLGKECRQLIAGVQAGEVEDSVTELQRTPAQLRISDEEAAKPITVVSECDEFWLGLEHCEFWLGLEPCARVKQYPVVIGLAVSLGELHLVSQELEGYSASLVTIYTRKCMSPLGVSPRAAARLLQESGLP